MLYRREAKMRLDELIRSVDNMTLDELNELVRDIRRDRLVSKRVQRTTTPKSRAKTADSIKALLAGMTAEQKQALLMKLTGG